MKKRYVKNLEKFFNLKRMIIKKIKINNIRSYLNQEISFPEGSVLLAGDIGTGKSSLLLAIEFSLFGLQKGELSGTALLRNGKDKGSIELSLEINNKDIIIHRELKRTKTGISQENCYIIIDDEKKLLTPLELKQNILNILNYPKETLTKKPLIYRYTVYTPQEQMKQILFDNVETRLNSIRKVFNLDRYGKIKENSKIVINKIRDKINIMSGIIQNLDEITEKKKLKETYKEGLNKRIKEIESPLLELKKEIDNLKEKVTNTEKEITLLNTFKKDYQILETELKNIIEKKESNIKKLSEIRIKESPEFNTKEKQEKESNLNRIENELKEITKNLNELNIHVKKSEEIINKIINLDKCPTCEQIVSPEYKENVKFKENKNIDNIKVKLENYLKKEKKHQENLNKLKIEIENLRKKENESLIIQSENRLNTELQNKITEEQKLLENNLNDFTKKRIELQENITTFKNIEEDFKQIKESLNNQQQRERELELKKESLTSELTNLDKEIISIEEDIKNKLEIKGKIDHYIKVRTWFTDNFIIMTETIEKNMMTKLNYDFNTIFQKWFNNIIDDENMEIKINENFSPLITQNNHDINYEYLSGGEKTAVALSYRLALNQVINSIMSNLNTKDLIILDEPTDGFSTEQLDRVRTVLNELNARQIILVSHESKIESFVDNVIKFNKKEHVSEISNI